MIENSRLSTAPRRQFPGESADGEWLSEKSIMWTKYILACIWHMLNYIVLFSIIFCLIPLLAL